MQINIKPFNKLFIPYWIELTKILPDFRCEHNYHPN